MFIFHCCSYLIPSHIPSYNNSNNSVWPLLTDVDPWLSDRGSDNNIDNDQEKRILQKMYRIIQSHSLDFINVLVVLVDVL